MRSQHSQLGKEEARLGAQVVCFGGRADLDPAAGAPSFLPWAVWTWSFSGAEREGNWHLVLGGVSAELLSEWEKRSGTEGAGARRGGLEFPVP